MLNRLTSGAIVIVALSPAAVLPAQATERHSGSDPLRLHYDRAEDLQRTGKLNDASTEYRAFIADALGELAMGYGLAHDYQHAAPLFDEALNLEPNSPALMLDYARTAVAVGDLTHAKTLATEFIQKDAGSRSQRALAHQVLGRTLLKLNQDQLARKELETAVDLDSTFANGYDLAVACLDLNDEKCAVQLFGEMEKSFGDTPEIHVAFGRAYGDSDFQPRAVTEFERAIEENPRLPGVHYLLAAVLLATGTDDAHVSAAEENLKKEIAISPRDAMSYTALGKIAATHNHYAEAETWLKKATALDPNDPDTWLYLGQIYFDLRRTSEAKDALRQCIRETTDVSRNRYQVQKAHFLLGRIFMQDGQQDAANAEMKVSRELANKTLSQDRSNLVGLMETAGAPEPSATVSAASAAPAAGPNPAEQRKVETLRDQFTPAIADSYNNLGAIAAANADYSGAVTLFQRASEWNSSLEGLDYNWGRAAFAGALFSEAIAPLTRYLRANPDDAGARSVLGISQFMAGKYLECIETLRRVVDKGDLAPQVEYVYADSLVLTGQVAAGADRLFALEKAHPEIPDVHRALGEALDQQGHKQDAQKELEAAIRLSPGDAAAHYDLGRIALGNQDTAAAASNLEAAVRLSPENAAYHEELARAYQAALRPADAEREINASNALRARAQSGTQQRAVAPE